jgi:hypothetical protein
MIQGCLGWLNHKRFVGNVAKCEQGPGTLDIGPPTVPLMRAEGLSSGLRRLEGVVWMILEVRLVARYFDGAWLFALASSFTTIFTA